MPSFTFTSPDGKSYTVNAPEGATPEQALSYLLGQLGAKPQTEEPGILSQLAGAPKEIVKGVASGLVQGVGGLTALPYAAARYVAPELAPYEETALGKKITSAEQYLAPSDEGAITQLAQGLGSFGSMFLPAGILGGVGRTGRFIGAGEGAAGKAAGVLERGIAPGLAKPVAVAQASGLGIEEARQRAVTARGEGVDMTPGQELAALSAGLPIGLTELLPLENLFKGLAKGMDEGFKFNVANLVKRGLQQGGIEGAQEVASGLMQDLAAKGIYNPNLPVGESMFGDLMLGGGVGAIAQVGLDVLFKPRIKAAYSRTQRAASEKRLQDELDAMRQEKLGQIANTKKNLGIQDQQMLALPAPAPQIEEEEKVDPLMNPVGYFNANELTPDYLKAVNNLRDKDGKAKLNRFSIEDLADAGAPQGEIDRLLAYKTGYKGEEVDKQDIFNLAQEKNIDVRTPGFADFLNRATGTPDVSKMSPVQLFSAFKALGAVEPSAELQVLPQGTNATRFTQQQYDRAIKNLSNLFPKNNTLGRSEVIQEIKDYSGLENDRDAESLLQTAIRNGELTTISVPKYIAVDEEGNQVGIRYGKRKLAEDFASKEGLSVRETTSIDIGFLGKPFQLAGGPDIRKGTFKQGSAPEFFEVRSTKSVLSTAKSQEEAEAKAERLFELRKAKAQGLLGQIAKHEAKIAKSQRKLESLEADGKADTFEYKKMAAGIAANNKNLQNEIKRLKAQVEDYSQPLEVNSKGEKPVGREGYTLFEQGQPVATFPSHEMATEAAVMRFDDDTLQKVATLGAFQKGLIPKDLSIKAKKEQARRRGEAPAGIGVQMTGTRAEAEAKLAEAGIFTGDFKKIADDLNKKLRPVMDKLGLGDLRLNILKAIESPMGTADGYYVQRLIAIAMDAKNPIRTLRHEGIHALKELGAFTPEQWAVLERKAKSEWMEKYDIKKRYKGLSTEEQLEEAISDAFSDFDQTKAPPGLIGSLFRKIKQFMEAFGNGIKGYGFQSADEIFAGVEAGQFRPAKGAEGAAQPSYALKPMSIKEVRVYEKELEDLVKKIGSRIAGMKSGETLDHVRKAVKKLQSYTEQGLKGKDWYENSANAVLEAFNGDPILAEKFFQIIAITSANTEVAANFTKAYNAWSQFAEGKPIKAGTENENKKIDALLNFGEDWDGRKTNSFYTNLMEAMEGKDTGRSTIDLHMTRMLFDKDAPTEAQYELAENMVRLLSSKVDMPARQIQAAAWVTQKARSMFDDYRAKGWKKNLSNDELMEFAFERALADYSHYIKAKVKQLPITKELREPSPEIRARVQNITGEVIPSVKTEMSQVEEMEFSAKEKLTKQIAKSNMVQDIANLLDIDSKVRITVGSGAYKSNVNPNMIVQVVNDNPEVAKQDALDLANAMSYVFKQDATPFFRADPALIGSGQLGYRFKFDPKALTPAKQKKILKVFSDKFGDDVGFTRVRANEIVIINYRGEDGTPFLASDENFVNGLAEIRDEIDKIATIKAQEFFGAESEYPYHDWEKDTAGTGLIEGIFSRRPQRPNLQRGLDNFRESFVRQARDAIEELGKTPRFSLRSDELVGGSGIGGGISIREQNPNAQSFDAVHYGKQRVNTLAGSMYGTGIKGAEAQRVFASPDPRVKQRAYFYIPYPNGQMPIPEAGLGNEVHIQRLNNLLAPGDQMQALVDATRGPDGRMDANAFEAAVIDAGFDGYAVPDMGMAVVLGADVPVISRGTRQEVAERAPKDSVQIGNRKYSLRQTDTKEFKQWFGKSKISTLRGEPKRMYHGTARDITEFKPKQANAIFLTDDPNFAETFTEMSEGYMVDEFFKGLSAQEQENYRRRADRIAMREGTSPSDELMQLLKSELPSRANIMPLYVRAENPFDYQNKEHVGSVIDEVKRSSEGYYNDWDLTLMQEVIQNGSWKQIEDTDVQNAIRKLGFDSFYVNEGGKKNLAVYDPNQIKSAIGNIGTFSRTDKDIRYALALGNIEPSTAVVPDVGGNADGNMGILPERLGTKPIRLLVGTHDDITNKGYGANHILNRVLSDPRRMPEGAEETLEKIARTAQRTAQRYTRIYKEGNNLVLFDGQNSLILSPRKDDVSIVTMYVQDNPDRKYGAPIWTGRAPTVAAFVEPVRGMKVEERGGRVAPRAAAKVITPSRVLEVEQVTEMAPTKAGKLGLKKQFALRAPETLEFKKWFKDSKVVDENSNPLVMYHGTSKDFDEFATKSKSILLGSGSYFTADPIEADEYTMSKWPALYGVTKPQIIPVFLSIKNPYVTDNKIDSKAKEDLIREKHDGIIVVGKDGSIEWAVAFEPNQIKSVFNVEPIATGKKFSLRDEIDPDIATAIDRTTTAREEKGFGRRIADALSPTAFQKFRQGMINKYESIERLSKEVSEKFGKNELLADTSAVAAALFSDRAAGVAASSFRNGVPVYRNGFTTVSDMDGQVKGLITLLEPLAKYGDPYVFQAFQYYAGTRRGRRLTAEGREQLFTPEDIKRGELLAEKYPEFKQVFDEYQKYNKGLVDFMKDTGVISKEEAKIWTQNWDYIPFYRQMDGERTAGPNVFSAIAGVAKPKKLKGGEAPLDDFMETIVRNSRAAIEAGMKNVAGQRVVRDILRLNQGRFVPAALARGTDIITVKENGVTKHYQVDDPLLVEALRGLNLPQLPFLEILAKPSDVLRNLVTKDPGFMMANLMRDSLQAWVTTGTNITPIVDTMKQYVGALSGMSKEADALARAGLFAGYDFSGDVKSSAREVEAELRKRTGTRTGVEKALLPITKVWDLLDKGSSASDVATRAEVYKRVLEQTGNEAEAMFQAMEVLNFSRKGNSALIRVVTALVPFMNARIQGLDVLYRSGFGKMASVSAEAQQKAFITRSLTLFALSSMYWVLASDQDEYKTAEPEVRDNYWIIGNVRIPIPFEIGTIFKVMPERIYEYFLGQDTSKDLKESIYRNLSSTLAFNPIPQAFLPAFENIANYSFFTGQPIVGKGMEDVAPRFQVGASTSILAQMVGEQTGMSPLKVDNLIRGYTGTIGTYAVMGIDAILRGEGDPTKATMKFEQMPVIKRFYADPRSTGTVTAYYDLKKQVDEAVRTMNFLERTGDYKDLQAYIEEKGFKMKAIQPIIKNIDREMTTLRDMRKAVQVSQMDPDRKREVLDNIRSAEVAMTERIQYLKKSID